MVFPENSFKKNTTDDVSKVNQMCDVYWYDWHVPDTMLTNMKAFQRVNHFPAMGGITKKSSLAHILKKMKEIYP